MAMKETPGSLRAYFLIAGVLSVGSALSDVGDLKKLEGLEIPTNIMLAIYVPIFVRLLVGVLFVGSGVVLAKQLASGARAIKTILIASAGLMVVDAVLIVSAIGAELGQTALLYTGIGILIAVYLYASVVRLAREARNASPG